MLLQNFFLCRIHTCLIDGVLSSYWSEAQVHFQYMVVVLAHDFVAEEDVHGASNISALDSSIFARIVELLTCRTNHHFSPAICIGITIMIL